MKADTRKGARTAPIGEPSASRRRIVYAPVTFSEVDGVRYLHFGTEWIQGAMRLRKPDTIELEYAQQMMAWSLFIEQPKAIAQLGLGAAALTRFCHRHYPDAMVTAVELNPTVVVAARTMFGLPTDDAKLEVLVGDAGEYVDQVGRRGTLDALQVDLYDATARGPVLDSVAFYAACRACLRSPGVMTVNLFGVHASFGRNMRAIKAAFDGRVIALPDVHDGNRIAVAFNGPPLNVRWSAMRERAAVIARGLKLPASKWVDGLRAESGTDEEGAFRI
ncbi:MAG: spermidine synthase [Burkholderiaceae bacterium]